MISTMIILSLAIGFGISFGFNALFNYIQNRKRDNNVFADVSFETIVTYGFPLSLIVFIIISLKSCGL